MTFKIPSAFNKVGVELEFYSNKNLYDHRRIPESIKADFDQDEDDSLEPSYHGFQYGFEFKSNGPRSLRRLQNVLDATNKLATMKTIGAHFISEAERGTTGLHIHFGIKSSFRRSKKKMVTGCLNMIRVSSEREKETKKLALRDCENWAQSSKWAFRQLKEDISDALKHYPDRVEIGSGIADLFADRYGTNFSNLFYEGGYKPTVEMRWASGHLAQKKRPLKKYVKHCMEMLDDAFTGKPAQIGDYELECTRTRKVTDCWCDNLVCDIDVKKDGVIVGKLALIFDTE